MLSCVRLTLVLLVVDSFVPKAESVSARGLSLLTALRTSSMSCIASAWSALVGAVSYRNSVAARSVFSCCVIRVCSSASMRSSPRACVSL